ncbi:BtrH N-terminal domain-containing protein [Streptomyces apocyni]|uniref:BtrH N-terminal domain-containing protein n=1 Tax=Streptomyces apocyni TaxID=2654677 RepID=UPI001E5204F0|nr:BtrH N-terminal domain-containing protein [Streptomyces apocyni]
MRVELAPVAPWRHELGHCLHATAGVLLAHRGLDPQIVLGAGWGFHYPGDLRREEYYLPGHAEDLFAGLAPHHGLHSRWHTPAGPDEGWQEVRAELCAGRPVAVAADNFHLPFRPAYRDVHTNHLMVVHGFDDEAGEAYVTDPVPPAYQGPLPLAALTAARDSGNPVRHDRDMFFTANPIGNRWLSWEATDPQPPFTPEFVAEVVARNVRGLTDPADRRTSGLPGLRAYLDGAWERLPDAPDVVDEVFIVAGPVLAVSGLHGDFLDRAGREFGDRRLRELARLVARVTHHWSALRIAVATARTDRAAALPALRRRSDRVIVSYEQVLAALHGHLSGLSPTAHSFGPERTSKRQTDGLPAEVAQ